VYGWWYLSAAFFKFPQDCLIFVGPFLLRRLMLFVEPEFASQHNFLLGIGYAVALLVAAGMQSIFLHQYFNRVYLVAAHVGIAIINKVYSKALTITSQSRQSSTSGEMVNLMSVDTNRMMEMLPYLHNLLWSSPFQIITALVYLYSLLGPATFAGLATMVLVVPLNTFIIKKVKGFQEHNMKCKDARVKSVNEALQGIRTLKCYGWEEAFMERIFAHRRKEIRALRMYANLNALQSAFWNSAPVLVSLATFTVYSMLGNTLTLPVVFTALALFNILRFPLAVLPMMLSSAISARVSAQRIDKFVNLPDLDTRQHHELGAHKNAVELQGTFAWDEKTTVLHDIALECKAGELTCVIGAVGAGKSSLLAAALGELSSVSKDSAVASRTLIRGALAYVPQQAWVLNATVRDNIVMSHPFDRAW
jgi:ABC-type multidrug transport system fused ATPase/permease subunit